MEGRRSQAIWLREASFDPTVMVSVPKRHYLETETLIDAIYDRIAERSVFCMLPLDQLRQSERDHYAGSDYFGRHLQLDNGISSLYRPIHHIHQLANV